MPEIDRRELLKYSGLLTGTMLSSGVVAGEDDSEDGRDPMESHKGPVGYETFRELDRLPKLRGDDGVNTVQFSSFDRSGGNNDGFTGADSCLRRTDDGRCVIAERSGPGEVTTLWFTRDGGDVTANGDITIELDGQTVVDAPLQEVVDGDLGPPFAYPLVANADQSSGGVYVKVPMPFREQMRITTDDMLFYRVVVQTYADAEGVNTFDPSDPARDVIETLDNAGIEDPKPPRENAETSSGSFSVDPGETVVLDEREGPGEITEFRMRIPQLVGPDRERVADDGRAFGEGGHSEFTASVDPSNDGVRITRRLDGSVANQHARVLVDGNAVAEWAGIEDDYGSPGSGPWVDQTVELPESATSQKSEITVRNEFVSSNLDFNEFTYWIESRVDGEWKQTDVVDVGPDSLESERAHDYRIEGQTWQGSNAFTYPVTIGEDVLASSEILRNARIRMRFDGKRTVDAPIGQFFGGGITETEVRALFFAMDTAEDGWYSSWWPMPFKRSAVIELYNGSDEPITSGETEVTAARSAEWVQALSPKGDAGYFHATTNRGQTTPGEDWPILDVDGRGTFVGVTHTMSGDQPGSGFLEGDERVYVDGSRYPQLHGTGTEDYYEGGWYFNRGTFTAPMNGHPTHENGNPLSEFDTRVCYRVMVPDEIPFSSALRFGIEHGPANDVPGDYTSTAFWYGKEDRFALERVDALDVGDPESEAEHDYTAPEPGSVETLTSSFVGAFQDTDVTDEGRATSAPVTFTQEIDPQNSGVLLRRTADHAGSYQAARVLVSTSTDEEDDGATEDGSGPSWQEVGVWLQPRGNETHRWIEDSFEIPASITAGESQLRIRLIPSSDAPPWHAARYETLARVPSFEDDESPSRVTGLDATGESNAVRLTWEAAADNVDVDRYEVHASKQADFSPGDDTLVDDVPTTGYVHDDLGLRETWHYRVRAVDAAGNVGSPSDAVAATTESTTRVEGESLHPPENTSENDSASVQNMGNFGSAWSNDAQLWFQADAAGDFVTATFEVPESGTYRVSAAFTRSWDYGTHELAFDGNDTGREFDGYASEVERSDPVDYGEFDFAAGEHTVTLTVTGQNQNSDGYYAGIDYLELTLTE